MRDPWCAHCGRVSHNRIFSMPKHLLPWYVRALKLLNCGRLRRFCDCLRLIYLYNEKLTALLSLSRSVRKRRADAPNIEETRLFFKSPGTIKHQGDIPVWPHRSPFTANFRLAHSKTFIFIPFMPAYNILGKSIKVPNKSSCVRGQGTRSCSKRGWRFSKLFLLFLLFMTSEERKRTYRIAEGSEQNNTLLITSKS